jgi:predicted component of type VI protein secretion system
VADQAYQLVVRKGPRPGQVFPLTLETITVGRDPLSDIVINDPEVSRSHATLRRVAGGGYSLQDNGSTNGSFVDGKRLGGDPVTLNPGQVIMFGSNVTVIHQATSASDPLATMIAPSALPELEPEEPAEAPSMEPAAEEAAMAPSMEAAVEPSEEPAMEPAEEPIEEPAFSQEDIVTPIPEPMMDEEEGLMTTIDPSPMVEAEDEDVGLATVLDAPMPPKEPEMPPVPQPAAEIPAMPEPMEPMAAYEEPAAMPAKPAFDSAEPLPDFDAQPAAGMAMSNSGMTADKGKGGGGKIAGLDRNVAIAIAAIILLCCCCLAVAAGYYIYTS